VASLSQGRTAAAQCGLFTHKSVPVIFEPPCTWPNNSGSFPPSLHIDLQCVNVNFRHSINNSRQARR